MTTSGPAVMVGVLLWAAAAGSAQPEDRWAVLRPLLGTWEGTSSGQPGRGTVRREYALVLGDRFIEVRNASIYPPQEKNPKGERHEDRGYISYDSARKQFVFRQFHVEGFVNTYVGSPTALPIVFLSEAIENIPAGFRARETYRLEPGGELVEVFELAEPGQEFIVYSETRLRRVQP
jgi:hypothetical protein